MVLKQDLNLVFVIIASPKLNQMILNMIKDATYSIPILQIMKGNSKYQLVTFPLKKKFYCRTR
jgi:hypothetical protein